MGHAAGDLSEVLPLKVFSTNFTPSSSSVGLGPVAASLPSPSSSPSPSSPSSSPDPAAVFLWRGASSGNGAHLRTMTCTTMFTSFSMTGGGAASSSSGGGGGSAVLGFGGIAHPDPLDCRVKRSSI
jgi:hypothetical protein